jgi:hypothetical protein
LQSPTQFNQFLQEVMKASTVYYINRIKADTGAHLCCVLFWGSWRWLTLTLEEAADPGHWVWIQLLRLPMKRKWRALVHSWRPPRNCNSNLDDTQAYTRWLQMHKSEWNWMKALSTESPSKACQELVSHDGILILESNWWLHSKGLGGTRDLSRIFQRSCILGQCIAPFHLVWKMYFIPLTQLQKHSYLFSILERSLCYIAYSSTHAVRSNMQSSSNCVRDEAVVSLNVGGKSFSTYRATLLQYPDSMLSAMLSGSHASMTLHGELFIDRDPYLFEELLDFLRSGPDYELPTDPRMCR